MCLKVVDDDGETVARRVRDEDFSLELDLSAGEYRVVVGTEEAATVDYRVQIKQ